MLSIIWYLVIRCKQLFGIHIMVCDCRGGKSNVDMWIGRVHDYLISTLWYVNISVLLFIQCWISGYLVYTFM